MRGTLMSVLREPVANRHHHGAALRSPGIRVVTAAALLVSLALGGAVVSIGRLHSSPTDFLDHPANPVSDAASEAQVVEPAREIVAFARLQTPTAGYLLMSCKNRDDPPYQGAVYLNFRLPTGTSDDTFFRNVMATMLAHGWREGRPPTRQPLGGTLYKDGVTAILYRSSDDATVGIIRLYGQCRNTGNHRNDTTGWVDITERLYHS
ncbi:MAG: hypothetical protein QJR12_16235 [Mycobacterium sp.]|uniref:hypothetical protein n=1 Tax=Mycobacterium sp. TaxID=1785 RepID=UPI0026300452|nr:hypothetical protein [Mycobacterium sp.]MDI3315755.1 hypothetical protein [Mycobacterium sp.]